MKKKLKIGWFSFTSCQGCLVAMSEVLNKYFFKWKKSVEFQHFKSMKSKNEYKDLDVAFIEGAISSKKEEERLIKIRNNSKKIIAVGSCAISGRPSASRNDLSKGILKKYHDLFERFKYNEKVKSIEEVVKVDDKIPGCPMAYPILIDKLEKLIKL